MKLLPVCILLLFALPGQAADVRGTLHDTDGAPLVSQVRITAVAENGDVLSDGMFTGSYKIAYPANARRLVFRRWLPVRGDESLSIPLANVEQKVSPRVPK